LGGASYPIYLNHELGSVILLSLAKRLFPVWGTHKENIMAGSLVLGVVIGIVMYLLVDRIVMARRVAYFSNARGKFIAVTGYFLVVSGLTFGILRWYVFS
jgi:peptidoglycan/LPS O-acetylase OafA/YrhL